MPMESWKRNLWAKKDRKERRKRLIVRLGGKCEKCGSKRDLEIHHGWGRTWTLEKVNQWTRTRQYEREEKIGRVGLLCSTCNKSAGDPLRALRGIVDAISDALPF